MKTHLVDTPFGSVRLDVVADSTKSAVLLRVENKPPDLSDDVRAAIYGAKLLGIERMVGLIDAQPLDRLLPPRGLAVPHDLVDLTRGRHLTFFAGKGYGFLPQQQPFCPELRAALIPPARAAEPRSAARGIVAAVDSVDQHEEARRWGAHMLGMAVSPATFLARELELCYAPLCCFGKTTDVQRIVEQMLVLLPDRRSCPCATAMQSTRDRGLVGENWRSWLP